jgi:hypothetical protein
LLTKFKLGCEGFPGDKHSSLLWPIGIKGLMKFAPGIREYLRVEYLKGASLRKALALPPNIRLDWKGLSGTNPLAYYG